MRRSSQLASSTMSSPRSRNGGTVSVVALSRTYSGSRNRPAATSGADRDAWLRSNERRCCAPLLACRVMSRRSAEDAAAGVCASSVSALISSRNSVPSFGRLDEAATCSPSAESVAEQFGFDQRRREWSRSSARSSGGLGAGSPRVPRARPALCPSPTHPGSAGTTRVSAKVSMRRNRSSIAGQ